MEDAGARSGETRPGWIPRPRLPAPLAPPAAPCQSRGALVCPSPWPSPALVSPSPASRADPDPPRVAGSLRMDFERCAALAYEAPPEPNEGCRAWPSRLLR